MSALRSARRLTRRIPVVELLMLAEVAQLAGRHVARLTPRDRRRLAVLLREARLRPSRLSEAHQDELRELVQKMEPRGFVGGAVERLSPLPLPERVLYGQRGRPAGIPRPRGKRSRARTR
jgi:hypothetical protein